MHFPSALSVGPFASQANDRRHVEHETGAVQARRGRRTRRNDWRTVPEACSSSSGRGTMLAEPAGRLRHGGRQRRSGERRSARGSSAGRCRPRCRRRGEEVDDRERRAGGDAAAAVAGVHRGRRVTRRAGGGRRRAARGCRVQRQGCLRSATLQY